LDKPGAIDLRSMTQMMSMGDVPFIIVSLSVFTLLGGLKMGDGDHPFFHKDNG